MRLLSDTCTFLWMFADPEKLSAKAREALADPANIVFLSVISNWEIAIKISSGRLDWFRDAEERLPYWRNQLGMRSLPLDERSTLHLRALPMVHRDPFDRMLVCQAMTHGLVMVTPDEAIRKYPVHVLW